MPTKPPEIPALKDQPEYEAALQRIADLERQLSDREAEYEVELAKKHKRGNGNDRETKAAALAAGVKLEETKVNCERANELFEDVLTLRQAVNIALANRDGVRDRLSGPVCVSLQPAAKAIARRMIAHLKEAQEAARQYTELLDAVGKAGYQCTLTQVANPWLYPGGGTSYAPPTVEVMADQVEALPPDEKPGLLSRLFYQEPKAAVVPEPKPEPKPQPVQRLVNPWMEPAAGYGEKREG